VTYQELKSFLAKGMRMSHIYQPVMIAALIKNGGRASTVAIAKEILSHDESQLEYYQRITRDMVGRVLQRRGVVTREDGGYGLVGYEKLSAPQAKELLALCREKLEEFKSRRGRRIFEHRRTSAGYVSGTLKYEVLKRARFRCELCGISAEEKALEVDHIIPRNKGGLDVLENLQALCYSCNAMKRDRDDTDFRGVRESYTHRELNCPFCDAPATRVIQENSLAYAIWDAYPTTSLHALITARCGLFRSWASRNQ
jgi:5-methylcytosine-specific restriction endonuclease McrA